MQNLQVPNSLPAGTAATLQFEACLAEGRSHALELASEEYRGDIRLVEAKLHEAEHSPPSIPDKEQRFSMCGKCEHIYHEGFLVGLKQAIEIIRGQLDTDEPSNGKISPTFRVVMWLAGGRREAFHFALNHHSDLSAIQAEIQESEELINSPYMRTGSMAPNASPRIAREGYLLGLREAVIIINLAAFEHLGRDPYGPE